MSTADAANTFYFSDIFQTFHIPDFEFDAIICAIDAIDKVMDNILMPRYLWVNKLFPKATVAKDN